MDCYKVLHIKKFSTQTNYELVFFSEAGNTHNFNREFWRLYELLDPTVTDSNYYLEFNMKFWCQYA